MGRIVSIDYGLSFVGIAISDENGSFSFPREAIKYINDDNLADKIIDIFKFDYIEVFIVGYPLYLNNEKSEMCLRIEEFAKVLSDKTKAEVKLIDERLTSKSAERFMHEMNMKPSKKKEIQNSISAAILLENYLDKMKIEEN